MRKLVILASLTVLLAGCATPAFQPLQTIAPVPQADAFTLVVQRLHGLGYTVVSSNKEAGSIIAEKDAGTSLTFEANPQNIRKTNRLEISVFPGPEQQTAVRVMPVSLRQIGTTNVIRDSNPSRKAIEDAEAITRLFGTG